MASDKLTINHQEFEVFESWVKKMGGQTGLVRAFRTRLKTQIGQPAISSWFSKRRIPEERREQLKALGWSGPWEWPDDEVTKPLPNDDSVSREEFLREVGELRGALKAHVEYWERGEEKVLRQLLDALQRIERLEKRSGIS